jgi:type I restriction enzyme S subunit
MVPFNLSNTVDSSKIFLVKRSELEERFEPDFYSEENKLLLKKIRSKKHYNLKELVSFSSETWNQKDYFENVFPYIEISEINLSTGKIEEIKQVEIINAPSRAKMIVRKNDIIVSTTRPTRGAISIFNDIDDIKIASTGFAVLRKVKENIISIETLFNVLRMPFCLQQMGQRSSGGNYPAITQEELGKILIPHIDDTIQQQIVNLYQIAYKQKQQKESQAKELLVSIDTYLLYELGITLPEKDNSLKSRIFTTQFSEVSGGRFDGYFYQKDFIDFFECLKNGIYPVQSLKKISKKISSGITPLSGGDAYTNSNDGIPFIRSGNIDINGDIDFDDLLYLKKEIHENTMKSSKVEFNDLMIAIVGATIGQIGIYLDRREANINQAIALIRLREGNNHNYIKEVIKSSIGQYNLNRLKRPVARANINLEEISTMQIIIPPFDKQTEIANHIQSIRTQAKQLQEEAKELLEKAKKEVEKIILG